MTAPTVTDPAALKAAANRMFEDMVNGHRPEIVREVLHPDIDFQRAGMGKSFVYMAAAGGGSSDGVGAAAGDALDGFKAAFAALLEGFPDLRNNVVGPQIAEGDLVATHITFTGTHQGTFLGFPATGRAVEFDEVLFTRIRDGRISEIWALGDELTFLEQIGLVDAPAAGAAR